MINKNHKPAEGDKSAAENEKRALWEVSHESYYCGNDETYSENDGKCEGEEPTSIIYQIHVQHEKTDGGKVHGDKYNRVWSAEPEGKNECYVSGYNATDNVS